MKHCEEENLLNENEPFQIVTIWNKKKSSDSRKLLINQLINDDEM